LYHGNSIVLCPGSIGPKLALEGEALFATGSKNPTATVEVERGGGLLIYGTVLCTDAGVLQMHINSPTSFVKWNLIRSSSKSVLRQASY